MMKFIMIQMKMLLMISLMNMMINIIMTQNKFIHPLILSTMLLLLCLMSSMNIEMLNYMNWISYLIYLIIIGGLMVIFLYFTSFISNMKMTIKWNYIITFPLKMMLMFIFIIIISMKIKEFLPWYFNHMEMMNLFKQISMKLNTMYMYMYNKSYNTIFCMIYLLFILMYIVKICMSKKLTLRKMN